MSEPKEKTGSGAEGSAGTAGETSLLQPNGDGALAVLQGTPESGPAFVPGTGESGPPFVPGTGESVAAFVPGSGEGATGSDGQAGDQTFAEPTEFDFRLDWAEVESRIAARFDKEWKAVEGGRILVSSKGCWLDDLVSDLAPPASDPDFWDWDYFWRGERIWTGPWKYDAILGSEIVMAGSWHPIGCITLPAPDRRVYIVDDWSGLEFGPEVIAAIEPGNSRAALAEFVRELLSSRGDTFGVDFGSFYYSEFSVWERDLADAAREGLKSAAESLDPDELRSLIPESAPKPGQSLADVFAEISLDASLAED